MKFLGLFDLSQLVTQQVCTRSMVSRENELQLQAHPLSLRDLGLQHSVVVVSTVDLYC